MALVTETLIQSRSGDLVVVQEIDDVTRNVSAYVVTNLTGKTFFVEVTRVRPAFGRLAGELGVSLKGIHLHHAFGGVAGQPAEPLSAEGLMFQRGQAAVKGTGHQIIHRLEELHTQGVKNPGPQASGDSVAATFAPRAGKPVPRVQREARVLRRMAPVPSSDC